MVALNRRGGVVLLDALPDDVLSQLLHEEANPVAGVPIVVGNLTMCSAAHSTRSVRCESVKPLRTVAPVADDISLSAAFSERPKAMHTVLAWE